MSKILFNIRIYFLFAIAEFKSMLMYRVDCLVGIFSQLLTQAVELIFLWIVFQNTENLAGWNFKQLLLLYAITMISVALSDFMFDATYDLGTRYIKDGEFDKMLLRPIHPLISVIGSSRASTAIGYGLLGLILMIIMLIQLAIPISIFLILKILFFAIIGAMIMGAIQVIASVTSFWTYMSNEFIWSTTRLYILSQYPLSIYNGFIKFILTCILPFAFVAYFPAMNYLGMDKYMIYLSPLVAIILWIIAVKVWNLALSKYRSTGS